MDRTKLTTRDGSRVFVRTLAASDAPALRHFNASLSDGSRSQFLPHSYDLPTLERIIARATEGTDRAYVAVVDGAIIGYFFLWDIRDPVPVLGIGLGDAFQGQGLGARFMEILLEDAKVAGCVGIELTTVPENDRAFSLYRKFGFAHIGDTDNIAGDGRTVRERVMFLALEPGAEAPDRSFGPPVS